MGNCFIVLDGYIKFVDFGLSRIDRDVGDVAGSGSNSFSFYSGMGLFMLLSSGVVLI